MSFDCHTAAIGDIAIAVCYFWRSNFYKFIAGSSFKKRNLFSFAGLIQSIKKESPGLVSAGGLFLLLQIGVMLNTGADGLIVSSNLGVAQVAAFSLVQRLFQFSSQPMSIMNAPLWGAYSDADARGDKGFIKRTLFLSLRNTSFLPYSLYLY